MSVRKTAIFLFQFRNTLSKQVWFKNQNCRLKLKFGTQINSNMQNSVLMFVSISTGKIFLSKFDLKIQNCQFKLKPGTYNRLQNI